MHGQKNIKLSKFQTFFKWSKFWGKKFHNLMFKLRMIMLLIHNYGLRNITRTKKDRNIHVWTRHNIKLFSCRSQWPRGLRRRSSAARLLRLRVRIPPGTWMFVCCDCCVLSGRGLCDELITRSEEFYRLWRIVVCDQETSKTRRLKPATGLWKYNHGGL